MEPTELPQLPHEGVDGTLDLAALQERGRELAFKRQTELPALDAATGARGGGPTALVQPVPGTTSRLLMLPVLVDPDGNLQDTIAIEGVTYTRCPRSGLFFGPTGLVLELAQGSTAAASQLAHPAFPGVTFTKRPEEAVYEEVAAGAGTTPTVELAVGAGFRPAELASLALLPLPGAEWEAGTTGAPSPWTVLEASVEAAKAIEGSHPPKGPTALSHCQALLQWLTTLGALAASPPLQCIPPVLLAAPLIHAVVSRVEPAIGTVDEASVGDVDLEALFGGLDEAVKSLSQQWAAALWSLMLGQAEALPEKVKEVDIDCIRSLRGMAGWDGGTSASRFPVAVALHRATPPNGTELMAALARGLGKISVYDTLDGDDCWAFITTLRDVRGPSAGFAALVLYIYLRRELGEEYSPLDKGEPPTASPDDICALMNRSEGGVAGWAHTWVSLHPVVGYPVAVLETTLKRLYKVRKIKALGHATEATFDAIVEATALDAYD